MIDSSKVLIVDDEPNAVRVLSAVLKNDGYTILEAANVDSAIGIIDKADVDAVITDLKMPFRDGYQLFDYISVQHPDTPVIFLTAYGNVESAVHAVTHGVFYYFIKPPDYVKLKIILAEAVQQYRAKTTRATAPPRPEEEGTRHPCRIVGHTPVMLQICKTIDSIKDSGSSILIQGETGTGKEIIAWNLHYTSKRRSKPFVAVNCAAIPRELIESELFGYEKGAFTGAAGSRIGKFEEVAEGTVFLDEIGELELPLQVKLLRVLQERTIERLGSNRKIKVNFRLVSSTNRDLTREMNAGRFREDLYYRINVVRVHVPPLRERLGDIPQLAETFMHEFCTRENKALTLSDESMEALMTYSWPGNVRELRNVIERAVVLAKGPIVMPNDLPEDLLQHCDGGLAVSPIKPLKALEHQAIIDALHDCHGNKSMAARILGISRKAFYKKLKEQSVT